MWRRVYDPSVRDRDPDPHTDSALRFGPGTVWRRVYDPSVRVRDPDPHRTPHRDLGPATVWRRVYDPSVRVRDPDPLRTPHRDLGPAQCGDGSTTRPSGSETRTHSGLRTEIWARHSVATGLRPVRPGQRPGPTPDPHRDFGPAQCGDGSTTRPSGSETRTHSGPTQRFWPRTVWRRVYDPSVRVRDPDPHRTPHRDLGPAQCGDGSTTRPSGSETRTHTGLRTEIWAPHSVATGLRPVRPGQRPGPTPGPCARRNDNPGVVR